MCNRLAHLQVFICILFYAEQLWVLDSIPGEVNTDDSDGEVEKVLQALESLPKILPSRRLIIDHFYTLL